MQQYVAFLRGINVNGINIRMTDLRAAFAGLGFTGVRTVLASGNVLFDTQDTDAAAIKARIEEKLRRAFAYDAWIVLQDLPTVRRVTHACPFESGRQDWHAYVLLASAPSVLSELAAATEDLDPHVERAQAGDGVLYWEVRRGLTTDTPFSKRLARARYKSTTTLRNLNTLRKIIA